MNSGQNCHGNQEFFSPILKIKPNNMFPYLASKLLLLNEKNTIYQFLSSYGLHLWLTNLTYSPSFT